MKLINKLNKKLKVKFFNKIDKAVDEVKYGLYARINKNLADKEEKDPGKMSAAIVNELFSLKPTTIESKKYLEENSEKIHSFVKDIKQDNEIKKILPQTHAIRLQGVFKAIGAGGSDEFARVPYNNLEKKGLLLKDIEIMDPRKFIKFAKKYIRSSPDY